MTDIDAVRLNFSPATLQALNIILGLVMFGVALDLGIEDFKHALRRPRAFGIGVVCQFLLFPALAFALVWLLEPRPSIALGMFMVAACPGGNMSNFFVSLSRGATALSVCMTAVSTTAAMVMTPFNVTFWGGLHPETAPIIEEFGLDPLSMIGSVVMVLGIPLALGLLVSEKKPEWADKLKKPFKFGSVALFLGLIVVAFASNFGLFLKFIHIIFFPVAILNIAALSLGYIVARGARLDRAESRAVSIEVGIQNSGLGLVLIFAHFEALGGMASVAAWWGIWHMITGLGLAFVWGRRDPERAEVTGSRAFL